MPALDLKKEIAAVIPADPPRAPDRFYDCAVCGQRVDRVNLEQVEYHDDRAHEPLPESSQR